MFEDEYLNELSPGESEAIDRIMMSAACEEDAEVDYEGMLRRIKKAAAEEGIAVFPGAKARGRKSGRKGMSDLVRTLLIGAGTAAAVFVMGIAALSVLGRFGVKSEAPSANVDELRSEKAFMTEEGSSGKNAHSQDDRSKPEPTFALVTMNPTSLPEYTAEPTQEFTITAMPEITADPGFDDIIPTSFPTKGGTAGVADLDHFVTDPAILEQLIPQLPYYMSAKTAPEENAVYAKGVDPATQNDRSYTCRMIESEDDELPIGYARFADDEHGLVRYIWRVTEQTYLDVEFSGFTREEAESLLVTMPLCVNAPAPTPYAAESRDAA
jgi:hypothetical protein